MTDPYPGVPPEEAQAAMADTEPTDKPLQVMMEDTEPTDPPKEQPRPLSVQADFIGAADLSVDEKIMEDTEPTDPPKEQPPHPPSYVQPDIVGAEDLSVDEKVWKGQSNSGNSTIKYVLDNCKHVLHETEIANLEQLRDKLSDLEDNSDVLSEISVIRKKALHQLKEYKMRGKEIAGLKTQLIDEANRKSAEAQMIEALVDEFNTQVDRLEYQYKLMPVADAKKNLTKAVNAHKWLVKRRAEIDEDHDSKELINFLKVAKHQLVKGTIWDRSAQNIQSTILARSVGKQFENTKFERIVFNPARGSFPNFIRYLRDRLADHDQFGTIQSKEGRFDRIHHCHLLEYQRPSNQPPRWFILELQNERAASEFYMRSDNLYISGFKSLKEVKEHEQMYEFRNDENSMPLLKNSIFFNCKNDYPALMNYERLPAIPNSVVVERLMQLDLSMAALSRGVIPISRYDHTLQEAGVQNQVANPQIQHAAVQEGLAEMHVQDPQATQVQTEAVITDAQVQEQIARIAIVVSEVCRFIDHFDRVTGGGGLDELLIEFMREWSDICRGIRNDEGGEFSMTVQGKIGLKYHYEAFPHLYFVLNTKGEGLKKEKTNPDDPKPPSGPSNEGGSDSRGKDKDDNSPQDERSKDDDNDITPDDDSGNKISGNHGTGAEQSTTSEVVLTNHLVHSSGLIIPAGASDSSTGFPSAGLVDILGTEKQIDVVRKALIASAKSFVEPRPTNSSGKPLFEVFSMHTNCAWIKHIAIFDDRCGKLVYKPKDREIDIFIKKRKEWMSRHRGRDASDFMGELVPSKCATSAVNGFVIEVDVDDKNGVFHLPWEDTSVVDKAMTRSIFTSRGDVHVTSVIFSNAVEASIDFSLIFIRPYLTKLEVRGELVLKVDDFTVGCKIFCNRVKDSVFLTPRQSSREMTEEEDETNVSTMSLPLNRKTIALPVGCSIHVAGSLKVDGLPHILTLDECIQWKGNVARSSFPMKVSMARQNFVLSGLNGAVCIKAKSF